jgi:LmbE family N-acetylglucosaminyl deacetylase
MEALGYSAIEVDATPAARATLRARKVPSLAGLNGRGWPDQQEHRRRYSERYADISAAREAWYARFPELREPRPRAIERAEWRDARVLVLSPHPDDELIGCGGTACVALSAGAKVTIVQATDGSELRSLGDLPSSARKSVRLDEASRVAAALGAQLVLWREPDGALECSERTISRLVRLLDEQRPTHVLAPFLGDPHGDHGTLSRILAGALARSSVAPRVLQFEVWSLVPANLYCEVTGQMEKLEGLLMLYERALRADDFVHFCEARNLARALELTGGPGYVEAFLGTTSAEYRRLADHAPR